jgi:isochorismate hydrolase
MIKAGMCTPIKDERFPSLNSSFPLPTRASLTQSQAKTLNIPIYITTQNASRLGATVSELANLLPAPDATPTKPEEMSSTTPPTLLHDKTLFSMLTPTVAQALTLQQQHAPGTPLTILITGIETHICVTQTTLDLLALGHRVYVLADGVSSCNAEERWVALERLRAEGATVTTSESVLFELLRDAKSAEFKAVSALVTKEYKDATKEALGLFCRR